MSQAAATRTEPGARPADPRRWPWWLQVLAVYALARAWSAAVLLAVATRQEATPWTPASPSLLEYTGLMWDADWYRRIATEGYPSQLPVGDDGAVQQNPWAFFPLFPLLVRAVMTLTGAPWHVAGPLVALVAGALAMLVIHTAVRLGAPRAVEARPGLPLGTVALVAAAPASPVLQVAYTESLAMLLVAGTLVLLLQRRYAGAAVTVLALGFTRAVALPMVVVVAVHAVVRYRAARSGGDPLRPAEVDRLVLVAVAAGAAAVAWPLLCGAVTGVPDAYLRTQAAWRGRPDVVPVLPWVDVARWLWGGAGPVVLLAAAVLLVAILLSPPARRLGPELQAWTAAYAAYLVGVIEPGTSLVRFGLLAFPLAAVVAGAVRHPPAARRAWVAVVLAACALAQVAWTWGLWRLTPPSGWPP